MPSQSARQASDRPFYASYSWAYDLLVTDPVQPWTDMVSATLDAAGITAPAPVLDAGCGTGRHAAGLARRGYRTELLDASASLLAVARARLPQAPAYHADLCRHPHQPAHRRPGRRPPDLPRHWNLHGRPAPRP
jgi:ubiquinone/menaquinone biosynthesis C-methylase UbiE